MLHVTGRDQLGARGRSSLVRVGCSCCVKRPFSSCVFIKLVLLSLILNNRACVCVCVRALARSKINCLLSSVSSMGFMLCNLTGPLLNPAEDSLIFLLLESAKECNVHVLQVILDRTMSAP
jgi:hypothetical protein